MEGSDRPSDKFQDLQNPTRVHVACSGPHQPLPWHTKVRECHRRPQRPLLIHRLEGIPLARGNVGKGDGGDADILRPCDDGRIRAGANTADERDQVGAVAVPATDIGGPEFAAMMMNS